MARKRYRESEPSTLEQLIEVLLTIPWWAGILLSCAIFLFLRWVLPWTFTQMPDPAVPGDFGGVVSTNLVSKPIVGVLTGLAFPAFCICIALVAVGRAIAWSRKYAYGEAVDGQRNVEKNSAVDQLMQRRTTIQKIGQLSWAEFEELLKRVFERLGYHVNHTGKNGPDGGIDLVLLKNGERTIVQCKHWQSRQVGVKVVREQLGLKHSHRAHHCVIVTSGEFTPDGVRFARDNGIILFDGAALQELLECESEREFQFLTERTVSAPTTVVAEFPTCPRCGSPTVWKVAKKGHSEGLPFWGCSRFPKCQGTIDANARD